MHSWFNTKILLRITSFILLVFLTICIACPNRQAIADDNYPDHTNTLPPYVQGLMGMFQSDSNYSIRFSDFEAWYQGNSVGTTTGTNANFGTYYDTLDVDFEFYYPASVINQTLLFEFYLSDVNNIDYIEMYTQGTYEAHSVCYYTYAGDSLYVVVVGGTIDGLNNTLRIHFKGNHAYTISRIGNFGTVKIHDNSTAASAQYNLANWMYWGAILKELETISDSIPASYNYSTEFTDLNTSVDIIESVLRNMRYGQYQYLSPRNTSDGPLYIRYFGLNNSNYHTYGAQNIFASTTSINQYRNFSLCLPFYLGNRRPFFYKVFIPVSSFTNLDTYNISYCYSASSALTSSQYDNLVFPAEPFCFVSQWSSGDVNCIVVNIYDNFYSVNTSDVINLYIRFTSTDPDAFINIYLPLIPDTNGYFNMFTLDSSSQQGFEGVTITYLSKFYNLLHAIADNTQYVPPPAGSDPTTNITNIYDIDVEFNNSVGDISLFESNYQQQLSTYDNEISSSYLIPVSQQYAFGSLNSEFQTIWSNMFSYDLDENNNKVGVYGLGLYLLIPLILFVICALFRRVTS